MTTWAPELPAHQEVRGDTRRAFVPRPLSAKVGRLESADSALPPRRPQSATERVRPMSARPQSAGAYHPIQNLYVVSSKLTKSGSLTNQFRSTAIDMEVRMVERMKMLNAKPLGPCPIRFQVLRELFEDIVTQDRVYGHLLAKIKIEYDLQRDSPDDVQDNLRDLYEEALLELQQIKRTVSQLTEDNYGLRQTLHSCSSERDALRVLAEERAHELQTLRTELAQHKAKESTSWVQSMHLQQRIEELETSTKQLPSATTNVSMDDDTPPNSSRDAEVEALRERARLLDMKVQEMEQEVAVSREQERRTLDQLRDLKVAHSLV
eukprot:TRINITY_DN15226_c0_g1_i1.p1 TRINITY_DN15226_c0_g1~~TRINITY_DN15226_c0_g1_i1.p1  ORF type:complete len:346 (+),score=55.34 TRINITY_DN15226_c0_g1_i1:77-1039(+)